MLKTEIKHKLVKTNHITFQLKKKINHNPPICKSCFLGLTFKYLFSMMFNLSSQLAGNICFLSV